MAQTPGPASRWSWTVPQNQDETPLELSLRADKLLPQALDAGLGEWEGPSRPLTRSAIQSLIDEGRAKADGRPLSPSKPLAPGARVEIVVPAPVELALEPEDIPFDVLYEDEHLIVVNKPPGLTVHPSETQKDGTLVHALLHKVKDLSGIGGVLRPGIVHRIDKDTSGALVVTKTDEAHQRLSEVFSRHAIEREYWALVYGSPAFTEKERRVESKIGRNPKDRKRMSMDVKDGRQAVTYVQCLERYGIAEKKPFAALVRARLETGRTHQVRVHLTGLGHSLLGDPVYGTPSANQPKWTALPRDVQAAVEALPGQALHARTLGFAHPISGKPLVFEAPPPPEFQTLLDTLRAYR